MQKVCHLTLNIKKNKRNAKIPEVLVQTLLNSFTEVEGLTQLRFTTCLFCDKGHGGSTLNLMPAVRQYGSIQPWGQCEMCAL